MLRRLLTLTFVNIVFGIILVLPTQAHLIAKPKNSTTQARYVSQTANLKHARYVCRHGKHKTQGWHCNAIGWIQKEREASIFILFPPNPSWNNVEYCLAVIIDRETAGTWDWTIYNYSVGPPNGAYGLPQALPKEKMARAGSDYMTNPWTQIKWMRIYVNERYGSACNAKAHHDRYGTY